MPAGDEDESSLRRWLNPVLAAAGFEWNHNALRHTDDGRLSALAVVLRVDGASP